MLPPASSNDLNLLPAGLAKQSRSKFEIVLPYAAALEAIAHLRASGIAFLGWEGWVQKSDGTVGHDSDFQGTIGLFQYEAESWDDFVNRTAEFCEKTIITDQVKWEESRRGHAGDTLCFCLSIESSPGG